MTSSTDYQKVCEELGYYDTAEGQGTVYADAATVVRAIHELRVRAAHDDERRTLRLLDNWHEDDGPVLWWLLPVSEPPYAGTPLDDEFPDYVTHWTRIPIPLGVGDESEAR